MRAVLNKELFFFINTGILIELPDRILDAQLNLNFR